MSVFEKFQKYESSVNPIKCKFRLFEVDFLAHKVDANGIRQLPERTEDIRSFSVFQTLNDLHHFLGRVNLYRKFISNLVEIISPLTDLKTVKKELRHATI